MVSTLMTFPSLVLEVPENDAESVEAMSDRCWMLEEHEELLGSSGNRRAFGNVGCLGVTKSNKKDVQ